ncbi:MAG: DUF4956 domain-containing protein [Clostridia bacterium]|nr:DUF4956 domain-containing protein [Clostridia bacterium]MBQ5757524.1 DUF4956 domain-containing protein [Clostridia bacterium]MCR5072976.1 DUF4956 domain-containing protein [Clostridiales bacterium]
MFSTFSIGDLFSGTLNPIRVVLTLLIALGVGGFLFLIYKKTFMGVVYSRSFNISLILLTMVSALVLMLISSNLTLSLGMVGALSIVRFRTAIKDPIDTVFMFWAVGEGLALGAGFVDVGLIGALVIGVIMLVIGSARSNGTQPYLLILHYDERASQQIKSLVKQLPKAHVKSKTVQRDNMELTIELRVHESETDFVDKFLRVPGVYDATLVAHQGDLIS